VAPVRSLHHEPVVVLALAPIGRSK